MLAKGSENSTGTPWQPLRFCVSPPDSFVFLPRGVASHDARPRGSAPRALDVGFTLGFCVGMLSFSTPGSWFRARWRLSRRFFQQRQMSLAGALPPHPRQGCAPCTAQGGLVPLTPFAAALVLGACVFWRKLSYFRNLHETLNSWHLFTSFRLPSRAQSGIIISEKVTFFTVSTELSTDNPHYKFQGQKHVANVSN